MGLVDFQTAVVDRSSRVPVVVDFWAPWCGPCRTLGPIIEELARGDAGRWELVKLNTDEQPEVARSYGIQGIPAVKLFVDGRVVAEFVGALPKSEIRRWIDTHLPDPRSARLATLVAEWERRGPELAADLERFVADNPDLPAGRLRLAQAVAATDPTRARQLIATGAADAPDAELADDVAALIELATVDTAGMPERLARALDDARLALARHAIDETLERLVDAAMLDPRGANQLARRASVALFHMLGQDHDSTRQYQRRLAAALHS
ncbi:MAG TPA: thioredoxin [Candidatus Polarisedimenticolaceae bacterium]|nr:thioredoxin [Candidatus Polarisedimenticolaceae bacterium]